jgi:hypothetical protein
MSEKEIKKQVDKQNNSGNYNSGYYNSGDCNSGYYNSGDCNSGDCNSGHCNSGDCNSGHCNSGNYNSGEGYINYFCTNRKFFLFDIEVDNIPSEIKHLDMSWFSLEDKAYKEAWAECPQEIINHLKSIPVIMKNLDKFEEITGLKLKD